jgi:hypothetical protein
MSVTVVAFGEKFSDRIIRAIRELACGRSNATGSFSLATAGTTTTVTAPNMGATSTVLLSPTNALAQSAGFYISAKALGQFTVTHSVNAGSRTFDYAIQG